MWISADEKAWTRFDSEGPRPQIEQPWFKGFGSAVVGGVEHALDVADLVNASRGDDEQERMRAWKEVADSRIDPVKMGAASRVIHQLTGVATAAVVGGTPGAAVGGSIGAAAGIVTGPGVIPSTIAGAGFGFKAGAVAGVGYLTAVDKYHELIDQGVDHETASKAAGLSGTTMALGAMAPAYVGNTLTKQLMSGVGINAGLGMIERSGTSKILDDGGYSKMAEHYKALDAEAVLADTLLGAFFPLAGRAVSAVFKTEHLDAAMATEHRIAEEIREPGLHTSLENLNQYQSILSEADRQLLVEGRNIRDLDLPEPPDRIPNPMFDAMARQFNEERARLFEAETGIPMTEAMKDIQRVAEVSRLVDEDVRVKMADSEIGRDIAAKHMEVEFDKADARKVAEIDPELTLKNERGESVSAKEILVEADMIRKNAENDSKLFSVAIACALSLGS